jgi:hypothetical protein
MAAIEAFHRGNTKLGEKIVGEQVFGTIPSDVARTLGTAGNVAFAKTNRQRGKAIKSYAKETSPLFQTLSNLAPVPTNSTHSMLGPLPPPPAP